MHEIQSLLLQVITEHSLSQLPPLRRLGELAGKEMQAQQVKHHLQQLEKKGFFTISQKRIIKFHSHSSIKPSFISLPMYGAVNCGPALFLAEQKPQSYIKISASLLRGDPVNLFVVKASGDSMNKTIVNNKKISDGDYLIIDSSKKTPSGKGEIVLSIIDGAANIKKFYKTKDHIVLTSDSTKKYEPIFINPEENFLINGTVIDILKNPRF